MKRWILSGAGLVIFAAVVIIALLPRILPGILSRSHPDIVFRGSAEEKVLYLTIDDAPSQATPEIMAVLKKHGVPATFFIIGNRVHSDESLRNIIDAGYSLGHHMRTTERCSKIPLDRFRDDFNFTDHLLRRFSTPGFFRPPSDFGTAEQRAYVGSRGYTPILGTVFPLDHWVQRPRVLVALVRWLTVPGGIIIMHDGDQRGHTTAEVLDAVLPSLKKAGYTFSSLSDPSLRAR